MGTFMSRLSAAALCAAFSVSAAPAMAAGVILDQASIPETGSVAFAGSTSNGIGTGGLAQSFTVGASGYLDHVAVAVENWTSLGDAAGVRFEVQNAALQTLFSQDITSAQIPDFSFNGLNWADTLQVGVRFANIAVSAGETYFLKVALLGTGSAVWRTGYGQQSINYAGGSAYSYDLPYGPGPIEIGGDFGFRTYVDTDAVPEPGAWALMILGFAGVGMGLRRRRAWAMA